MSDLKFDIEHPQDYWMSVDVGDKLSEFGKTVIHLTGDGEVSVEHSQVNHVKEGEEKLSEKPLIKKGKLKNFEPEELFRKVEQVPWTTKFPPRPGIPDEAIVIWKFGKRGGDTLETKMWLRDAEKNPIVGELLKGLRQELQLLTNNEIVL
jgi:hypothetical protein